MNRPDRAERLRAVTDRLEAGVAEVFESERYREYLSTMAKFHRYSFGNILLIAMQHPGASRVAGYNDWKNKFGRQVKKGEVGIRILAPCAFTAHMEVEKIDPATGQTVKERVPVEANRFKVVTVFDVSQTEGKELPTILSELRGGVKSFSEISGKLQALSPVPVAFEHFPGTAKGYFSRQEGRIVVRPGMSEVQTVKTLVHEIAHAKLHADKDGRTKSTREVEAESVAYVVCQRLGVDTSDYSFIYVAVWSKGKDLRELRASLDTIRTTAAALIDGIEGREPAPPVKHRRKAQNPAR